MTHSRSRPWVASKYFCLKTRKKKN
uniref:Uncharacterized protein n=1 Tax=Anguilla anguilla TaxID=7936 RepID=A0A0E9SZI0_ANGAN